MRFAAPSKPLADEPRSLSGASLHIVRGREPILRMQQVLAELSERCGQPGVMDDVGYFLSRPGELKRVPHLLLVSKAPGLNLDRVTSDDLLGAVLLYRYTVLGCGIRTFTTNDRYGHGTVVAPVAIRSSVAVAASRGLLERGALVVLISFRDEEIPDGKAGLKDGQRSEESYGEDKTARWAWRVREIPGYLPLEKTFDATLAGVGHLTRRNMRYYRRRAEAELGCTFLPAVQMDKREFLAFNRECMYAVPAKVAAWRYDSLKDLSTQLFMGTKDRDGRWLSLLGGRRQPAGTEILWQMNRDGLSVYSLSIVMRSYFLEHEIEHGMTRLYMEGGTSHPMQHSFVKEKVTDLVVLRRSPLAFLIPRLAKRFVKHDNELAQMLLDKSLLWRSSEKSQLLSAPEGTST